MKKIWVNKAGSFDDAKPKMPKNYCRLFLWLLPIFFDFARHVNCIDFCRVNGDSKNTSNVRSIPTVPMPEILFSY